MQNYQQNECIFKDDRLGRDANVAFFLQQFRVKMREAFQENKYFKKQYANFTYCKFRLTNEGI